MKKNKSIIISLIKDDLTNLTLVKGLNNLGLEADRYSLGLSESIIKLINSNLSDDQSEMIHEYYCNISSNIIDYNLSNITLDMKAEEIYKEVEIQILKIINDYS